MLWTPEGLTPSTDEVDAAPWDHPPRRVPTTLPRSAPTAPHPADLDATRGPAPGTRSSAGRLRLPAAVVAERRAEMASRARVLGGHHSLRIWRAAHRDALIALAREASGMPTGVECLALLWVREGDLYHVSATFASPCATVH